MPRSPSGKGRAAPRGNFYGVETLAGHTAARRGCLFRRGGAAAGAVAADTRTIVEHLADDELEGRLTGSAGIRRAADYIIEQLEAIGAEPLPGRGRLPPGI